MIRLAHFVTHPIQYFTPLYRQLAEQPGIDLTVYFGSKFGLEPSFDEGFGRAIQFDVPLLAGYSSRFLANLASGIPTDGFANFDCPEVDRLLSQYGYDALWVHGWGYKAHWQCFQAARRYRVPLLIRADTNAIRKPKYSWQWLLSNLRVGRILRGAAGCLFIGKSNREYYLSMGVEMTRLFPAHYSVETRRFKKTAASVEEARRLRDRYAIQQEDFVVVCLSKVYPQKRLHDAIQTVGRLGRQAKLWVVGDGVERLRLEQLAEREAPGQVTWHGFVNQMGVAAFLGAADVLVLPSKNEAWGLVVNEAMAAGLPVVCSSRVGCAPDLVRPAETGFVYPVGDVATLTTYLKRLMADRAACRRMGHAAQQLVSLEYDVAVTARQIADAVRAVVSERRRIAAPVRRLGIM